MRSTRAAAAWAGIALATSFLSVTIIGAQPHTAATGAIAKSVALGAEAPRPALKHADVADRNVDTHASVGTD